MNLPIIRTHERIDYKRCPKKWYWKWRKGLVPKAYSFGALELGTWLHTALALWYGKGSKRHYTLASQFIPQAELAISLAKANNAPEHLLEKAEELTILGEAMAIAYEDYYGKDPDIDVIEAEIPLEFTIGAGDVGGTVAAIHRLKPDLVYRNRHTKEIWLMEHKSATQIRTTHLVIDDQARPYGVMAERALIKAGVLSKYEGIKGITYNFLRKGMPDLREKNEKGQALNKDGSVSKKQPAVLFLRHPVLLTRVAKLRSLRRIQAETLLITTIAQSVRNGRIDPADIPKTQHHSCPKTCQFFDMCVAEENGTDISTMEQTMFVRKDPYEYDEDTTDEPASFEMG